MRDGSALRIELVNMQAVFFFKKAWSLQLITLCGEHVIGFGDLNKIEDVTRSLVLLSCRCRGDIFFRLAVESLVLMVLELCLLCLKFLFPIIVPDSYIFSLAIWFQCGDFW